MKYTRAACVWVLLVVAAGCGNKEEPDAELDSSVTDGGDLPGSVVYASNEAEMKPVLDNYCVPCHSSRLTGTARAGAPLGIDYDTYEAAVKNAVAGNREVQAGAMPPSGAKPTDEEKQLFQRWVDSGLN